MTNKQNIPLQRPSCVQKAVHTVCQAAPRIRGAIIFPNISCRQGDPRKIPAKGNKNYVHSERQNVEGKVERNLYGHPRTKEREPRHGTGLQDMEQNQQCEERKTVHTITEEKKQIQTRATRRVRTELRKTMFSMITVEKWTNLAAELREAKFLYQFKNQMEKQKRTANSGKASQKNAQNGSRGH